MFANIYTRYFYSILNIKIDSRKLGHMFLIKTYIDFVSYVDLKTGYLSLISGHKYIPHCQDKFQFN